MREPIARHAAARPRRVWASLLRGLAVVVAVLVVSSASLGGYAVWRLGRNTQDIAVPLAPHETVPPPEALDGAFNVLLVGADNEQGQHGFGAARDGTLNDVDILVHVAADHRSGVVISLPRDLEIPHPRCVDAATGATAPAVAKQQLNAAFSRGGLGCVVTTVESVLGLDIPYAAQFTFAGTVRMADAVGGVPVCVTKPVHDTKSGLSLPAGVSTISGRTALAYLRARHKVGDNSDLARIQSQQAYMSSLLRTMTSADTLTNPQRLYGLATAATRNVVLSRSLADPTTLVRMAVSLKSVELDRMVFVQYPTLPDPANDAKVVPDPVLAATLVDRVQRDRRIVLDDRALGDGVVAVGARPTPTPTATSSPSAAPDRPRRGTVPGLKGRTAAQQTCSVTHD